VAKADSRSFPFTLRTTGLPGGTIEIDPSENSQMLSALLIIAPQAKQPLDVHLKNATGAKPVVEMTRRVMQQFAAKPADYFIEGYASAGSYFLAVPLVTSGSVTISNYNSTLQGDRKFLEV